MKYLPLLFLTFLTFTTYAQIYKWVDENGVTHFSTTPQPKQIENNNAQEIRVEANNLMSDRKHLDNKYSNEKASSEKKKSKRRSSGIGVDCRSAVRFSHQSIQDQIEVAKTNMKSEGFKKSNQRVKDQKEYIKKIKSAKPRISITQCETSKGEATKFYKCMEKGYSPIGACLRRYPI